MLGQTGSQVGKGRGQLQGLMTWLQWAPSLVPAETRAGALRGAATAAPPLCTSLLLWALPLQWSTLPSKHPRLQSSSGLSPQPPSACFLGWLSKLQIPAPRPCAQLRTPLSGWGALAAARTLCADLAPSCQPQARCCAISKSLKHPPVSAALLTVKRLL